MDERRKKSWYDFDVFFKWTIIQETPHEGYMLKAKPLTVTMDNPNLQPYMYKYKFTETLHECVVR